MQKGSLHEFMEFLALEFFFAEVYGRQRDNSESDSTLSPSCSMLIVYMSADIAMARLHINCH